MKYRKGVFIVVYSRQKTGITYLVLKRKLHWTGWEFPKGGTLPFESKRKAVIREMKEETGLKAEKIKKFNFHGKYPYKKKFADRTGVIGQTFSLFAVEVKNGKVRLDKKEHAKYEWHDFKKALEKISYKNQKKSLKIVNDWLAYK